MASPTSGAPDLPDFAPVPRASLGPAVNDQGYYVGRVERNLYWVTDGDYHSAFLTTPDGVMLFDAGFRTAALISGGLCAAGGLLAPVTIVNPRRSPRPAGAPASEECRHHGLDAPPLTTSVSRAAGT